MFKNYLVLALRSLIKNKALTGINILGLAIGISASLVIFLLVNYHFSFDKFQKDSDRIYRVVSNFNFSGERYYNSGVCNPMAEAVKQQVTGIETVVPFRTWGRLDKVVVTQAGKKELNTFKRQEHFVFADSNYFSLVPYTWLAGSAKNALINPYTTVLTSSLAEQYFPSLKPEAIIGKEIIINDTVRCSISGIVEDLGKNSDFTFKAFISYNTLLNTSLKPEGWDQWGSTNGAQQLYLKLAPTTNVSNIEKQIAGLYERNNKREPGDNSKTWHTLQPLSELHFDTNYGAYSAPRGHKPTLYGLLAIAAFLLLLGCINFINLTTAYASQRAKEIGIRKTMGSSRKQLVTQFLSETFLLTLVATLLSVVITPLILKAFSGFIPGDLHFNLFKNPTILLLLVALIVVVTLLSGFYPAMILSGYKPVLVLKKQVHGTGSNRNVWLRKSLTVSQFTIAQVFIMAALLVSKQITFSLNKDLGFKKDAIVYLHTSVFDTVASNKTTLFNKLKAIPEIEMLSLGSNPPSTNNTWSGGIKYKDGKLNLETDVQHKFGDTNYIKLYQLQLLAGKNFMETDTVTSFLINETYARILGFGNDLQNAVGKNLEWNDKLVPIAGVVGDFHYKSMHEPIKPLVIGNWKTMSNMISMALRPASGGSNNWSAAIQKVEKSWKEVYPDKDFEYNFLDKDLEKYYEGEKNISNLLQWATGLAIFISCLGLLGLVIYTTTQRTKEIGVRKVLGASVSNIVRLISKEFLLLVVLAFIIAAPLAWIAIHQWLDSFAYRTSVSWWIFGASGLIMVTTALATLSFQTIKAALANPVKALRSE